MRTRTPKEIDAEADDLLISYAFKYMAELAVEAVIAADKLKRGRVERPDIDRARRKLGRGGLGVSTLQAAGGIMATVALTFFSGLITDTLNPPGLFWLLFGIFLALGGLCIVAPFVSGRRDT